MRKIILALSILIGTQYANALGQTPITKVKYMSVYPDAVFIQFENTHGNEDGCTHSRSNEFVRLTTSSQSDKLLYSAVLTAYTANLKVSVAYDGCIGGFPRMIRMDFVK